MGIRKGIAPFLLVAAWTQVAEVTEGAGEWTRLHPVESSPSARVFAKEKGDGHYIVGTEAAERWEPSGIAGGEILGRSAPSQEYYWSDEWQRAEKESLAEIRRGEGVKFDSFEDAIRWLQAE